MSVITPNAGLLFLYVVFVFFAFWNIAFPVSFLSAYGLDIGTNATATSGTSITPAEKMLISGCLQSGGLNLFVIAAVSIMAYRSGTDAQKSIVCLMNGLGLVVNNIVTLCAVSYWVDLGVSSTGIYITTALFFIIAVVNFLGADKPVITKSNMAKPLYWGFIFSTVIYVFYMFFMFISPDSLMDSYGVKVSAKSGKVLAGMFRYAWAPAFLHIALVFIAQLIVAGPLATYGIARWMAIEAFAYVLTSAVWAAVWTCIDSVTYETFIKGQFFNMFLWMIIFFLFYYPVALMDRELKEPVETFIGAVAKKATKKKAAPAPAAAEPVTAEVQPLLPPLMPLATTPLQPSYSMVQQPVYQYAPATTSYANPVTTAYAAPAATAYAAPITMAPGTMTYTTAPAYMYAAPVV